MPFAKFEDIEIYYEIHGEGEPMLLINGLKADHKNWLAVLEDLKNQYQVVLFDNRGAGRTKDTGEPFTVSTMAQDTANLIRYLNLAPAYVVGHSLGGAVAQVLAYQYPELIKKLFLCNTFIKLAEKPKKGFFEILTMHEAGENEANIMEAIFPWGFSAEFLTPDFRQMVLDAVTQNPFPQSTENYRRQYNALIQFDSCEWINKIQTPTVVIGSKKDMTALPEDAIELANQIPHAQLRMLPGAHASQIEEPKKLIQLLVVS